METILTTSEREMLIMLLQKEEKNLYIEINHTWQREFKRSLQERLQMVNEITEKLKINEPSKVF